MIRILGDAEAALVRFTAVMSATTTKTGTQSVPNKETPMSY